MSRSVDAIVIGSGVIGTATTRALAAKGYRVLCVDKLPMCGFGSTAASSAIVHPCYASLEACAAASESEHLWRNWSVYIGGDEID